MHFRTCAVALSAVALVATARPAAGAVTLLSAEMASGNGFKLGPLSPPPQQQSTTFSAPVAFPNDAQNIARVGPEGLQVLVNRTATDNHHPIGNLTGDTWTAEKFTVVFRLDEAAPFTYHRQVGPPDDPIASATLQAEGQPAITLPPIIGDVSGMLPAGLYTFSGLMDYEQHLPTIPANGTFSGGFTNLRLTVAPEPGAVPLLAVGGLLACRRRGRVTPR
jgi:hypothetical protein